MWVSNDKIFRLRLLRNFPNLPPRVSPKIQKKIRSPPRYWKLPSNLVKRVGANNPPLSCGFEYRDNSIGEVLSEFIACEGQPPDPSLGCLFCFLTVVSPFHTIFLMYIHDLNQREPPWLLPLLEAFNPFSLKKYLDLKSPANVSGLGTVPLF